MGELELNISETAQTIGITAIAVGQDTEQRPCADVVIADLESPLSGRHIIDGHTGRIIDLRPGVLDR